VAYLGYDSLPGAGAKYAISTYLKRLVGRIPDFDQRLGATEQVVEVLARNHDATSQFKPQLDALRGLMQKLDRTYVFHDWLAAHYHPDTISSIAARTGAHGLRHVADATFGDHASYDLDEDARRLLALAGDDFVDRAEALAVLRGTRLYRTDLLVHADAPPPRRPDAFEAISYSFTGSRVAPEPGDGGAARYDLGDSFMATPDGTIEAILDALAARAPAELGFETLQHATGIAPPVLETTLRGLVLRSVLKVHSTPQPFTLAPGEHPRSGRLIRSMLNMGDQTVSLRHRRIVAEDRPARLLVALADGTRSIAEIAGHMQAALGYLITETQVRSMRDGLARQQIFEA
jgi:hypothetical protein